MAAPAKPIPVTMLSGFLGAGAWWYGAGRVRPNARVGGTRWPMRRWGSGRVTSPSRARPQPPAQRPQDCGVHHWVVV